jgi:cytochrome c oxidase cbb3-type subunit 2
MSVLAGSAHAQPDAPYDEKAARALYRKSCAECHGRKGRGDGERALSLGFRPRDFSLGAFKCRCTPSGSLPSDEDLMRVVSQGLPGTPMTGFADSLSLEQRRLVVGYVKSLTPGFAREEVPACEVVPDPPPVTAEGVAAGASLYRLLGCWKCHGAEGRGDGPSAEALVDDWGERIRVADFVRSGKLKCGSEPASVYRTFHTGMNGSPMPSFAAAFEFAREDIADPSSTEALFGAETAAVDRAYLARQPARGEKAALSRAELDELAQSRSWALVHYLRSLLEADTGAP